MIVRRVASRRDCLPRTDDHHLCLWLLMYTGRLAHARTFSAKNPNWPVPMPRRIGAINPDDSRDRGLAGRARGRYISEARTAPIAASRSRPAMADATLAILAIHAHPDDLEFQCAGTLALLAAGGVPRDDGDDDPRRLRQRRARRRGDRRDPPGGGQGGGRPDRRRVPLPGVPRPGDLQRRRVAAAGRPSACGGPGPTSS